MYEENNCKIREKSQGEKLKNKSKIKNEVSNFLYFRFFHLFQTHDNCIWLLFDKINFDNLITPFEWEGPCSIAIKKLSNFSKF